MHGFAEAIRIVPFVKYEREFKTIDVSVYASADEIIQYLREQDSDGWWLVNSIRQEHSSVEQGGEFIRMIFARTVKAE